MSEMPFADELGGRLSASDVAHLSEQIAGLSAAGLPLAPGLRALGEEVAGRRLRSMLERLANALDAGQPLEAALDAQRGRLPAHLRGLVLAGARTGKLGDVLARFAGYTSVGADLRRSLWMRLVYPAFSLGFALAIFLFVCVVLMTGFSKIFQDFGMPVPVITRVMLTFSRVVAEVWWPLLKGIATLLIVSFLASLVLSTSARRAILASVPLIGPVIRLTSRGEFSHLLALLLESEVPLAEALTLAGEGVGDRSVASASETAARAVEGGQSLATALSSGGLFPAGFARILAWAEDHRGLPEALHMAGEMFEARARSQANFVSTLCGVLAVLSILGGVLTTIMAILVPMISLIGRLSG
jgi:general secretion pathway protein F